MRALRLIIAVGFIAFAAILAWLCVKRLVSGKMLTGPEQSQPGRYSRRSLQFWVKLSLDVVYVAIAALLGTYLLTENL